MAFDDERRLLAWRRGKVRIRRRIVKAVRRQTAFGRELGMGWDRDKTADVGIERRRALQYLCRGRSLVDPDDGRRLGR